MSRGRVEPGAPRPSVTVVLPVRNESSHLDAVLGDVLGQDYPPERMEVLVVDGSSTDDTRARAERFAREDARVRVLDNPRRLSSAARALGAAEARGDFVAYVDGHCRIPARDWLSSMVDLFERTGADCLARPQPIEPWTGSRVQRAIAAARSSPLGHSTASDIFGDREGPTSPVSAGAMYRREVFDRVGSFDPAFDACEDVEFNWRVARAGLSCFTSPRLAVRYESRRTLPALFRQMVRYGLGRGRLHRKHPAAFTAESLVPASFVLGLPALVAAPWLSGVARAFVVAPYALYALLVAAFSVAAAARRGWDLLPVLPAAFATTHVGLGMGYLRGLLSRPRSAA